MSGCPGTNLAGEGEVYQDNEDTNNANGLSTSWPVYLSGTFNRDTLMHYCTYSSADSNQQWPSGSYCLAKYTDSCPSGFTEGSIYWDDEDTSNANSVSGFLPTGTYGRDTKIYYCCRNDGSIYTPMVLPAEVQFFLYQYDSRGCQRVAGTAMWANWRYFDDEDHENRDSISGSHPHAIIDHRKNIKLFYCYYF